MKFLDKIRSFLSSRIVEEEKKMTSDEELAYISERLRVLSEEKDISVLHISLSGNKHTCVIKGTMGSISATLEKASEESIHFKAVLASLNLAGSTTRRERKHNAKRRAEHAAQYRHS